MKKDIFDIIKEERGDIFDIVLREKKEGDVFEQAQKQLPALAKGYIKEQIAEIKTLSPEEVTTIVEEAISKAPAKVVERVIEKETIKPVIKEVERKDAGELESLREQIEELKKEVEKTQGEVRIVGTLLPNFHDKTNKFLRAHGGQLGWGDVSDTETTKYFGDSETDGSYRITVSGTDLLIQRRESGSWVTKSEVLA